MDLKILLHTARLARLQVSQKEAEFFAGQLKIIFEHFNILGSYPCPPDLEPLVDPLEGLRDQPAFRADTPPAFALKDTQLLALAPELSGREYQAPAVLE